MFDYQLVFSAKRKTLALEVRAGKLTVRAPNYLSRHDIERFIASKQAWIHSKLTLSQKHTQGNRLNYQSGSELFYQGTRHYLDIQYSPQCISQPNSVIKQGNKLVLRLNNTMSCSDTALVLEENISAEKIQSQKDMTLRQELITFFTHYTHDYLSQRLDTFAQLMSLQPNEIKVRLYKSKWGSCNTKGNLTFNALLAMVPTYVFDYLIVHELAHLKHMNHSPSFWQLVAVYCPDYQKAKRWLTQHRQYLSLPDVH